MRDKRAPTDVCGEAIMHLVYPTKLRLLPSLFLFLDPYLYSVDLSVNEVKRMRIRIVLQKTL